MAVVTGVGAITPLGVGGGVLVDRWCAGLSGIHEGAGVCDEFSRCDTLVDAPDGLERFMHLGMAVAEQAIDMAWGEECPYPRDRVACYLGASLGELRILTSPPSERGAMAMQASAAQTIAMRVGFGGECRGIMSACASGAQAIGAGVRALMRGEADAVIVGAAEAPLCPLVRAAFASAGALSRCGLSRPFDARRDGFILSEGAAMLVLETADGARRRGAEAIGEVLGYGTTTDAHHLTAPQEQGLCAARAMQLALEDAAVEPEAIDYVNAHGTSTPLNDRIETVAIAGALGEHGRRVPISSTKSAIGHSLGASGAVEAVATLLSLRRGLAPPNVGLEQPDASLGAFDFVIEGPRPLDGGSDGRLIALSNSFAFGGHNATLVLAAGAGVAV
jgi:3-oxoacyl-[acyl-carrier-protein] synthase II